MKGTTAFEAMEGIDPRYILEAAPDAPVRTGSKARYIRIAAVAAVVAALAAVAVIGAGIMKQSEVNPPVVPPIGETQDTETPTEGETQDTEMPTEGETETDAPVLDGSFSTPDYNVTVIDGQCYLNFAAGNEAETDSNSNNVGNMSTIFMDFLRFDSLAEMKHKLMNNQLTDEQRNIIKNEFTLSENGFEICNVQELIQPVFPSDISLSYVYLYGKTYSFFFTGSTPNPHTSGLISFGNISKWEAYYQECMDTIEMNQLDSHETSTFDGAPCEIFTYTTHSAQIKEIFVTLPSTEPNTSTHIVLKYILQINSDMLPVSDTVPLDIQIYGEKNGIYFDYLIQGLTQAPTVEWLSAFSIAPYVDTGDHTAS